LTSVPLSEGRNRQMSISRVNTPLYLAGLAGSFTRALVG
jgi:hypothetical protein